MIREQIMLKLATHLCCEKRYSSSIRSQNANFPINVDLGSQFFRNFSPLSPQNTDQYIIPLI